jgi:hypothetical protein
MGSSISNLTEKKRTRHPPKANINLRTSAHSSQFNHDHHGQILACCSHNVPTATAEEQMQTGSSHAMFDVLKRPTMKRRQKLSCSDGDPK